MRMGAHRGAVAVLGLGMAVAVVGCGSGGGAADGGPGRGGSGEGAGPRPPTAASAPDVADGTDGTDGTDVADVADGTVGTDVAGCFDGRCRILVTQQPTRIPVDDRFGVGSLEVTSVTARSVVVRASGGGTFLSTSVGEGGTGSLNGLGFRVTELRDGRAVLDFFPQK
ncbi:hypothetical protein [Streptomyces sp. NPDC102462]|uniref:hypothetical protein n=1 Tax=Streptomyces sp. NPDC102462 TaxID=3366178 RepID=UPI003806F056